MSHIDRIAICQCPGGDGQYVPLDPGRPPTPCFIPGCECTPVVYVRVSAASAVLRDATHWDPGSGRDRHVNGWRAAADELERAFGGDG